MAGESYFGSGHAAGRVPALWGVQVHQVPAVRVTYVFALWKRKRMVPGETP